ncbi:hypothetical protein QJS04_geneDACA001240 [Acorus gramineus]|uniref:Prostaglandin E synthase 2 n=1 Tax=Acorus gramineus TaxID=55184 RepID=A0AAV9ABD1_ACOGR|nr:hypothetical protein QJS04_geneDACA001240 [Acorus gramineus]
MMRTQALAHLLRRSSTASSAHLHRFSSLPSPPRLPSFVPAAAATSTARKPSKSAPFGPFAGALSFSAAAAAVAVAVSVPVAFAEELRADKPEHYPREVVLYQYEACPFCNKVKAYLDYNNISYKVVEVNPISKKELKWSDYKKVPILVVDGEQLVDSTEFYPLLCYSYGLSCVCQRTDTFFPYRWVDEHLVHVLSPNIYRNTSEALESFDYITSHGNFSRTEKFTVKYAGAAAMYMVSKKLKKKYNITDERAALYGAAETWVEALGDRDFLGGSEPNLADLAVFGVLRPIRYLKSGRDMVENTRIGEWYQRMESAVGESARISA